MRILENGDREISVMTFNIHKGKHALLPGETLKHVRDFIASHAVDVLFLQEVVGSDPKNAFLNQAQYLAEGLSSQFCYGHNVVVDDYHHGNAILSRYPILEWKNTDLSTNRFEKRGLLEAVLELPDGERLKAFCCHLNLLRQSRRSQVDRISKILEEHYSHFDGSMLLAGDFNDWAKEVSSYLTVHGWREVGEEHAHHPTFPSWWPRAALDRIYYRGDVRLVSSEALSFGDRGLISDHVPILGKFVLKS